MFARSSFFGTFSLLTVALSSVACGSSGVGDPCIPEDEYRRDFGSFKEGEVNVESPSFQCDTRLCLVNNFRGRVSCPYGQTQEEIDAATPEWTVAPSTAGGTPRPLCAIPGTDGTGEDADRDRVKVEVAKTYEGRRADDAVYCSCRCANADGNTDDGARYCDCPDGFICEPLVRDWGLGSEQLAGSYCIKDNDRSRYNEATLGASCAWDETKPNDASQACGPAQL